MNLDPCEAPARDWHAVPVPDLWRFIESLRPEQARDRPLIVAVDGRSAAGKTTVARALAEAHDSVVVVHADDIAWWEPLFAWDHLLRRGILEPLHAGRGVAFTPPQWRERGREGAIEVPASVEVVLIEGVGASCASVAELIDVAVWVQSDGAEAERRGIERDAASGENGDYQQTVAFWHNWSRAERTYLERDRPWLRADLIVSGTPPIEVPPGSVAVGSLG